MSDLVNMMINQKSYSTNMVKNCRETFKNTQNDIGITSPKDTKKIFENLLNKANIKNNEVSKNEHLHDMKTNNKSIKDDFTKGSCKCRKEELDTLLLSLLKYCGGEKTDIKSVIEELNKEELTVKDIIGEIMNLIEGSDFNEETELLSKMKSLSDEDNLEVNRFLDELQKSFMESSKEENTGNLLKERIIKAIEEKLNQSKVINNDVQTMHSIENNNSIKILTQMENISSDTSSQFSKENKEEEFLKGLTSNNKSKLESRLDKITNFMNDFNKINSEISSNKLEAEAPININKNNLVNDFIKSVKYMEQNNVKEMTVKVKPQELGEVVIRLTVENGLMKANITANNKEAYNLLNSKLQDLNNSLGNGEIKIQNFTIDIYNGDTTFFSRENSREQRNNSNGNSRAKNSEVLQVENSLNSNDEMQNELEDSNVNAFV